VVAVLSSVVATVLVGATALVAAATSCGFAGGRCDNTSGGGSPVLVAVVAAAVAWGATVWVARARNGQAVGPLYVVAVAVPAVAAVVAVGVMVASA
jgi:hypothetical protein